ncbi:MAG: ABC transporter ATP-binding protein [Verrucomicrobiota bacterium]
MIRCRQISYRYPGSAFDLAIDAFHVEASESVALAGPSGCGKTTLLNLIAGHLVPESGEIETAGKFLHQMSLNGRQSFRLQKVGQVPQGFDLLDYLSVFDNILLPIRLDSSRPLDEGAKKRCGELAERAGIADHLERYPDQLSTGERQRAAVCRGLIGRPRLILADEPTGNLDPENQDRIVSLLLDEAERIDASVLMITHEPSLFSRFDRVVNLLELRKEATR